MDSILDEVTEFIFNLRHPSGRTMALRWTQPLTEMRMRNLWGGGGGMAAGSATDNLATIYELLDVSQPYR
jgi:hypothetical protein